MNKTYVAVAAGVLVAVVGPAGEIREVVVDVGPAAHRRELVITTVGSLSAQHLSFSVSETTSHGQYAERPTLIGIPTDPGTFFRSSTG